MSHPESRIPPRLSHTPPPPPTRRPGPRAVLWGSLSLFAVLFVLLTFQLSASASPASTGSQHSSVAARKAAATEVAETTATEAEAPVEAEAEAAELEALEAEAVAEEEIAPVVTSSS